MGVKLLSPFGVPPTLQQTIHIQVGQHGAGDSPNAKDNFEFERRLEFRRKSSAD
jgi:hypothetical protein